VVDFAVGQGAGAALLTGNQNIYLGRPGAAFDAKTMRPLVAHRLPP
jgi:hypothetical protein